MEEILNRFPQIGEKILLHLDDESLQNCRRVNKSWKRFIENPYQKQLCIKIIKGYENHTHMQKYISVYGDWNVLRCNELDEFTKEVKRTKNKFLMELLFLEKYERTGTKLSAYDERGLTILHWYTSEVNNPLWKDINYPKIIKNQMAAKLMGKLQEYDIDINAKQKFNCNSTPLHLACIDGNTEIVRIMMDIADNANLDFNAKCLRWTGLQIAMLKNYQEIVDIINAKQIRK